MGRPRIHPVPRPGDRFGRWTVLHEAEPYRPPGNPSQPYRRWLCECGCGTTTAVAGRSLTSGRSTSCGCWSREVTSARAITHGLRHTGEWNIWQGMKTRCLNPRSKAWPDYGGRGIAVCDEWRDSFEAFYRDMGPRPSPRHTLERRENDGPYARWNCRWATKREQNNNRRSSRFITYNGERMTVTEAARRADLGKTTLERRVRDWPEERWFEPVSPARSAAQSRRREVKSSRQTAQTYRSMDEVLE